MSTSPAVLQAGLGAGDKDGTASRSTPHQHHHHHQAVGEGVHSHTQGSQALLPSPQSSTITTQSSTAAPLEHNNRSDNEVIAFSSGSTPALTSEERKGSVIYAVDGSLPVLVSHDSFSLLDYFFKRRVTVDSASTSRTAAVPANAVSLDNRSSYSPSAINEEGILASLLLPSVKIRSPSSPHIEEERLYIASRNKVHRPLATTKRTRTRTRTTSGDKTQSSTTATSTSTTTISISELPFNTSSRSSQMPSNSSGVPASTSASPQRNIHSRDYGYPTQQQQQQHSNHSSIDHTQSSTLSSTYSSPLHPGGAAGVMFTSPFGNNNVTSSSSSSNMNGQSTITMSTKGNSSKASQMLGLSPHHSDHLYLSHGQTSPPSETGRQQGQHVNYSDRSPTTSTGSNSHGNSNVPQSHTRMTLKKARSLFSSGKNKQQANSPEPSPTSGSLSSVMNQSKPMGMGSYGESYIPSSATSSSAFSNGRYNGAGAGAGQSTLNHSKSHGSLSGYAGRPSYEASSSAPLPPLEAAYHPYATSSRHQALSSPPHQQAKSQTARSVSLGNTTTGREAREAEQDVECPICLESLSIRLQGEKPHVVPMCGHKLHNECFEAAYGTTVAKALNQHEEGTLVMRVKKRQPIGICGICRSEMKIGDPSEMGKNKFAMISGQPGRSALPALDTHKIHSISKRTIGPDDEPGSASLHDPSEDQDVVNPHQLLPAYMQHLALGPARSSPFALAGNGTAVMPKISVRAEHTTLNRVSDPEKRVHLTCLVTVEIPSRVPGLDAYLSANASQGRPQKSLPQPPHSAQNSQSTILGYHLSHQAGSNSSNRDRTASNPGTSVTASSSMNDVNGNEGQEGPVFRRESNATAHTHGTEDFPTSPSVSTFSGAHNASRENGGRESLSHGLGHGRAISSGMEKSMSNMTVSSTGHTMSQTPATTASAGFTPHSTSASSFDEQEEHHHALYASAPSEGPGNGPTYNANMNMSAITLTAAQEEKTREAHGPFANVFKDLQDRMLDWKGHEPSTFGSLRMYDALSVKKDKNVRDFIVYLFEEALLCVADDKRRAGASTTGTTGQEDDEGKLRLKGRVFVKHMKQVEDTSSVHTGLSLTIHMEDDSLENFVILFPHRESLEVWRSQIQALIDHHRPPIPSSATKSSMTTVNSRRDSVFSNDTNRSAQSSMSRKTKDTTATSISNGPVPSGAIPPVPVLKKSMPSLSNAFLDWTPPDPATFVPLDLMLVLSVPRASSHSNGPSSSGLKLRLIKSTLDFILHAVGPRARVAIVAYTTGDATTSSLRKTPWLATGRSDGMRRLEQAVAELAGEPTDKHSDEGLTLVDSKEAKVTVATAVNLALDIMLQRTSKSTTSGMIVLNDAKDGAQKQHIDLVLARTDAGGVPIHTFGWGKTHDPSSLWLLSNHTKGTYTFVRDFYQLREAMAGCIGGMLCVAVHTLRLHVSVQERRWFKIRKVAGVASAIVSSDGKDVDIDLGELRFGEKKEMLVEVEMSSPKQSTSRRNSTTHARTNSKDQTVSRKKSLTATDDFFLKKVGVDPLSLGDDDLASSDFFDEVEEGMAEDVPVFDVSASFKDPQDPAAEVCKLPYPSLLTITVAPPAKASDKAPDSPASVSTTNAVSDPTIVRRRMELLTSDMITRTLLLMSRKQDSGAQRLLMETTRIFSAIIANLIPPTINEVSITPETRHANDVLQACLEDIEQIKKGTLDRAEFDNATRNFGAQQAVALRDQRAWTARTSTEALFFCREWTAIFGKALNNQL